MDVFVRRRQLNSIHVHSNRNDFSSVRTAVHHFIPDQGICFRFGRSSSSESLFPNQTDLHTFKLDFDKMEVDLTDDAVFQVVETFVVLEIDMKTLFNTDLHFHGDHFFGLLDWVIRKEDSKIDLFAYCGFIVSIDSGSDEISDSTGNSIKGFVLFFEIGEFELPTFTLS